MRGTKVSRKDQKEQNLSRAEGVAALRYPRKDVASPLIGDRGALLLIDAPLAPLHLGPIVPRAIKQLSGKIWSPGAQGGTIRKALISWLLLFRAVCCLLSCLNPISIFMEETRGTRGGRPTACCGHQTQFYQNDVFNLLTCPACVIWSTY